MRDGEFNHISVFVASYTGKLHRMSLEDLSKILILNGITTHNGNGNSDTFTGSIEADIEPENLRAFLEEIPGAFVQVHHPNHARPEPPQATPPAALTQPANSPKGAEDLAKVALWEILDKPLGDLNLPPETLRVFYQAGLQCVGHLVELRPDELTSGFIVRAGHVDVEAVHHALAAQGLKLQMYSYKWLAPDESRRTGKPPEKIKQPKV